MEKVTIQDIADSLNISRVTVSKALHNHPGVSDSLRSRIFDKAREIGYGKVFYQTIETPRYTPHTVSLVVSRPDSALFWTSIIHRMAQELSEYHINLIYTYVPSVYSRGFTLPPVLLDGSVDGIIVLNVYDSDILSMINELALPKVFFDTVPSLFHQPLNGDLLLIEGFHSEYSITECLIQKGLTRIGFLGDIQYAQTNLERYRGFSACMKQYGLPIDPKYCFTESIAIFSYEETIAHFLNHLKSWPEAFVCVSDYMAHFVRQYIDENPEKQIPSVILTGFDNSSEYANITGQIITANIPTELLGKRLALQLLFRTEHPNAPTELTFIRTEVIEPEQPA